MVSANASNSIIKFADNRTVVGPDYQQRRDGYREGGLDAELYYVRDDVVNHYALSFILPVSSETNSLHFTWRSKDKVDYRMGFHVDNPAAMNQPQSNISNQGEVPRTASVFRVDLFCSGKVDGEAVLTVQLNLTIHSNNFTVLNFKRRKICHKRIDPDLKMPPVSNNKTVPRPENGVSIPTTPPGCSIISVSGSSALVIFLVAIVLAVMHLHSMRRVELDDSVSDSGSSQGLSQPSTQTTQYLRADTPNNASAVTNHHPGTAPILQLAAATFPNPGAPVHETRNHHPGTAPILQLAAATFPNPGAPVHETRNVFQNGMFLTTSTVGDERSTKIGGTVDIQITAGTEPLSRTFSPNKICAVLSFTGTFGRIFHGVLLDEKDPAKEKQCFVKTVKDRASEVQVTMCLTESCKYEGSSHRNLLPISHVCTEEGERPMVLLPYMNWGNLKLFLRQCKLAEANNPQAISQQDLVHMAIQIACGMSYLARREVIHKDLASRNCVIDNSMQVKICDNALSRDLFPMDYHCLGDNENRPVRWMALESLLNHDFSSASDVWAFGVTLWELMTLGQTPYVDIDPFEMAAYLKDGYRIAQPINCPDELFAVMACCWALDPEERPKFQQLVQCLTEFHAALGAYV
ncbi:LOW QUALITY PROTEIN: tyrosine-protein kinase RYK [Salvelinus sp. IW2-2015]|uniref:LOW QUALITY PROTEIN: tyrosine-protein kinase RYK n=1 Tax=Salvelinus sp. IW2-2015 TaxID=2691554 RepID=UPI0038D37404